MTSELELQRTRILAARALAAAREAVGEAAPAEVVRIARERLPFPSDPGAEMDGKVQLEGNEPKLFELTAIKSGSVPGQGVDTDPTLVRAEVKAPKGAARTVARNPRKSDYDVAEELILLWGTVMQATSLVTQRLSEGLERAGITAPFFDVLVRLAQQPDERMSTSALATEVSLTTGGFFVLLDRMEKAGLVTREHSSQDPRVIFVVVTDSGRETAKRALQLHVEDLRGNVLAPLGEEDAAILMRLTKRLRDYAISVDEVRREVDLIETKVSELTKHGVLPADVIRPE